MKLVNENIKNALRKPTTQRKGRIFLKGSYYDVYNVEYYADAYNEGNVIGNAIASQLDFDLPYMDKFETFEYYDGIWTGEKYDYVYLGEFIVFDERDEDEFNKHITAFDKLINFNAPFKELGTYPKTLFEELQNICQQANVPLINTNIPNGDFIVENNQFVGGESLKTVLKAICQISGNYAVMKTDGLKLQLKNQTDEKIGKEHHEPVAWKRRSYGINRVVLGLSDIEGEYVLKQDDDDIKENGVHQLVINNNPFAYTQAKRQALLDNLFEQVRGFGYIPYELNGEWLNYLEVGDSITIDDIETIILRINGKSPNSLESTMSAPAIIDSSIEYVDNTNTIQNQLNRTEIIVDKQNQSIESVVEQTNAQNQKIAQITQTVEELNSKISDIADITVSVEDNDGRLEFENINQSEPIRIVIRPISESISYIYPSHSMYPTNEYFQGFEGLKPETNLTPSETLTPQKGVKEQNIWYLKNRILKFHNTKTGEIFEYELPDDLLYLDSENYDEFILDYDSLSCVINKKLGYTVEGNVYILENPQTIEYKYPHINLTDGDYTIYLEGYDSAYIFVRLMVQNIYTTQFATRAELNSEITQTANSINLEVSKKLDSEKFNGANIMLEINRDESLATINADKVNISGVITAINNNTSTTIDGDKITAGTISTNQLSANSVTVEKVSSDIITTQNFNAQNINADNIVSGTLTGRTISGGLINGATITGGSINIQKGNYYFNMGTSTSNPNCSGLNVGNYGIKANSDITATRFAITNDDVGKSESFGIRDYHGGVHYFTFKGGILTAWEYQE